MNQIATEGVRWTTTDLELLPENECERSIPLAQVQPWL